MPTIHILDETTINQIAAGEVVERPASVIKELVENSIDAGATSIEVEIADGGISYMRITDNGCGMSEEDARLAILRHATSKIKSAHDLFDIASLGFRGEAIASIASVSQFTLCTRQEEQSMGTRIYVEGGTFKDCDPYGMAPGTTIEVKDLFFNTPARRKFLKTARTESNKIQDILGKLALSHNDISFKCIVDNKVTMLTPGSGNLIETVAAIYGFKVSEDVFPIAYEAEGIYIEGAVSKPTVLKSSRQWQTLIINHRVITDKAILKAIDTAYHAMLPKGGYPLVILQIVVPSESVDINVHPRKSEVKFSDEKVVFKAVYHAILQALEQPSQCHVGKEEETIATAIDYDKVFSGRRKGYEVIRERTENFVATLRQDGYTPPIKEKYVQHSFSTDFEMPSVIESARSIDSLQEITTNHKDNAPRHIEYVSDTSNEVLEPQSSIHHGLLPLGQVASCYILAKKGDDLYIIDQHAAHERVRYDILCKSSESIPSQELLMPLYINVSDEEMTIALESTAELRDLGFLVDQGGPSSLRIDGYPLDLVEKKVEEILRFVFSYLIDYQMPKPSQLRHEMLAYASCRGAIKAGHILNMVQIDALLKDLFHTDTPYVCPHGRPTIIKFTPEELGKLFLRS